MVTNKVLQREGITFWLFFYLRKLVAIVRKAYQQLVKIRFKLRCFLLDRLDDVLGELISSTSFGLKGLFQKFGLAWVSTSSREILPSDLPSRECSVDIGETRKPKEVWHNRPAASRTK